MALNTGERAEREKEREGGGRVRILLWSIHGEVCDICLQRAVGSQEGTVDGPPDCVRRTIPNPVHNVSTICSHRWTGRWPVAWRFNASTMYLLAIVTDRSSAGGVVFNLQQSAGSCWLPHRLGVMTVQYIELHKSIPLLLCEITAVLAW